jgi:GNAT superfamily N-acetyltransferase
MSSVSVREAQAGDAEGLARLCTQLGYPAEMAAMPSRLARIGVDRNARAFVAVQEGQLMGLVTIHLRDTLNHNTPIAQITLLVVDETTRAKGIGRALVAACEEFARQCGARRIAVTTALDRAGAHAFYEHVGYRHTGRRYAKDFPASDA